MKGSPPKTGQDVIANAKDAKGDKAHQIEMGMYSAQHPGFRNDEEQDTQSDSHYQVG